MLKIVVIDANAISRNLLVSVLTNGGHDVIGDANTSSAGVASMIKLRPQLVCIDIGEERQIGLNMLETIRNALPKALVFLVSGKMDPVIVQNAVQLGAHGFIVKPFNAATVLGAIRNAVLKIARQHQKHTV
ncbi:response regulator [Noviherbaspirillum cavernae]|uniref:Response regulator n=1 Tax=Noviherbaspirillum cavernae TaxID=2320862 RepID=A0A418WWQ6_9BURK|nr:response regulator [Noviherbaspirillum cavernae]RJG04676.1 response regulator [Noviherbaspirillum cavernae]